MNETVSISKSVRFTFEIVDLIYKKKENDDETKRRQYNLCKN